MALPKIYNQIWLDTLPKKEEDKINVLVLLDEQEIGVFQESSEYSGNYDLVGVKATDPDRVKVTVLQTKKVHNIAWKTDSYNKDGWDFTLTVKDAPRGPKQYFSAKGLEIDSSKNLQEVVKMAISKLCK